MSVEMGKNKKLGFRLMRLPKKGDAIDVEQQVVARARALECIKCGACEEAHPQHRRPPAQFSTGYNL